MKQRRLGDLYVVGKEVTVDDGMGEPITVYLRKLTINDQEDALRRSNAARARILSVVRDPDAIEHQALELELAEMDREEMLESIVASEISEKALAIEAEAAAEEEWTKDDYLQGLQDSWAQGLQGRYVANNDDEEAKHVYDEIVRFNQIVSDEIVRTEEFVRSSYEDTPESVLREKVFEGMIKAEANRTWIKEFRRCEIYFATRQVDNRRQRYFLSRDEIDELDLNVFTVLLEGYRDLSVEVDQGKSLPPTPSSSSQSKTPEIQETEDVSGLQTATA